jgi:hypothetical protein
MTAHFVIDAANQPTGGGHAPMALLALATHTELHQLVAQKRAVVLGLLA